MTVWVLANIGQRDLCIDGKPPQLKQRPQDRGCKDDVSLRELGEKILRHFEDWRDRLSAQLLEPALEDIRSRTGQGPICLILYGTDQQDEEFKCNDTIFIAHVIARMLEERFSSVRAEVKAIKDPPHDYDLALGAFERLVLAETEIGPDDQVYALTSGGTPACNLALMFVATRRFKERSRLVYVSPGRRVGQLQFGARLLDSYRLETAQHMLENYDFSGIAYLFDQREPGLLAEYALRRANLDLEGAERILGRLERLQQSPLHDRYARIRSDTELLKFEDGESLKDRAERLRVKRAQLAELFWQLRVKLARCEYADALGRFFHLHESYMCVFLDMALGIVTERDHGADRWRSYLESLGNLPPLWEKVYGEKSDLDPNMGPTRPALRKIIANARKLMSAGELQPGNTNITVEKMKIVDELTAANEKLADLRNQSLPGHGFKGVSRDSFEKEAGCSIKQLLDRWAELLAAICIEVRKMKNPFDELRETILEAAMWSCEDKR